MIRSLLRTDRPSRSRHAPLTRLTTPIAVGIALAAACLCAVRRRTRSIGLFGRKPAPPAPRRAAGSRARSMPAAAVLPPKRPAPLPTRRRRGAGPADKPLRRKTAPPAAASAARAVGRSRGGDAGHRAGGAERAALRAPDRRARQRLFQRHRRRSSAISCRPAATGAASAASSTSSARAGSASNTTRRRRSRSIADGSSVAVRDRKLATQDLYAIGADAAEVPAPRPYRSRPGHPHHRRLARARRRPRPARGQIDARRHLEDHALFFDKDVRTLTALAHRRPAGLHDHRRAVESRHRPPRRPAPVRDQLRAHARCRSKHCRRAPQTGMTARRGLPRR